MANETVLQMRPLAWRIKSVQLEWNGFSVRHVNNTVQTCIFKMKNNNQQKKTAKPVVNVSKDLLIQMVNVSQ